jgi:14-3-3 protein epsilon
MNAREKNIFLAKVSDQAERYDEMINYMKAIVDTGATLTYEERDLLNIAYKNAIGSKRSAWRVVSSVLQRESDDERKKILLEYRGRIESEMQTLCADAFSILDKVIASADSDEFRIYFHKMKGDYNRYLAEVSPEGEVRTKATEEGLKAYQTATELAEKSSPDEITPLNLGLALNFSVFYYEILRQPEAAIKLAKKAFDNAIMGLDKLNEEDETYKDATQIMALLRDNLEIWQSEGANE